jgi:hypothetical protein
VALEGYYVAAIDYKTAMVVVVEKHYLHRKCPCSLAFGLFDAAKTLKGVVCYGTPSSSSLRVGLAGASNTHNILELTRLWVADDVPRNGESFLIGSTLTQLNKEIVVSYADTAQGHVGTVYQATNWLYTGLSAKRTNWTVAGVDKHSQTLGDKFTSEELRALYGDKFTLTPRSRKHRYVYLCCSKARRKVLLSELKYPLLPYPKKDC